MQKSANYAKLGMEAQGSASGAKDWLATNSARHGKLDIKDRLGAIMDIY